MTGRDSEQVEDLLTTGYATVLELEVRERSLRAELMEVELAAPARAAALRKEIDAVAHLASDLREELDAARRRWASSAASAADTDNGMTRRQGSHGQSTAAG